MDFQKCSLALSLCVALPLASNAEAGVLGSDNFDYAVGEIDGQNGGTGWSDAWTNFTGDGDSPLSQVVDRTGSELSYNSGDGINIQGGNRGLQFNGVPAGTSNNVPFGRSFSSSTATYVTASFLIQSDTDTLDSNDFVASWYGSTTSTSSGLGGGINNHQNDPNVGPRDGNTFFIRTPRDQNTAGSLVTGETNLVVARFTRLPADGENPAAYRLGELWINPSAGDADNPIASSTTPADSSVAVNGTFNAFGIRLGSFLEAEDSFVIDGLRIAESEDSTEAFNLVTSAAFPVPEPSTIGLLLAGGLMTLGGRRRRA